jgi:signal transduction histidine kinase
LVADDEPHICTLKAAILECAGYTCTIASNVRSTIERIQSSPPIDIIVTDHRLGDGTSSQVVKWLEDHAFKTPVIIISGYVREALLASWQSPNTSAYFEKPVNPERLVEAVARVLSNSTPDAAELYKLQTIRDIWVATEFLGEQTKQKIKATQKVASDYKIVLAAAVHDLKGELMHIAAAIRNLRTDISINSEHVDELELIDRGLFHSNSILKRLMAFLEYGAPSREPVSVSELLEDSVKFIAPRFWSNIRVSLDLPHSLVSTKIWTDKAEAMSILSELCTNAARAIGTETGIIRLSANDHGRTVRLIVTDNGPGINSDVQKALFHKAVQSTHGSGVGLYLSSQMASSMGGELELDFTSPGGTQFSLNLPKESGDI